MNRAVYLALGLVVGLLAGWLLFGSRAGPRDVPTESLPSPSTTRVPDAPALSPSGPQHSGAGRIVFRSRTPEPSRAPQELLEPAKEIERLRGRVAELEKRLSIQDSLVQEKLGVPIKPPEHLDARFDQDTVRGAINAALKEVGLEGEATAVDCSEYPCLAVGEIKGAHFGGAEADRLTHSAAFRSYSDDSKESFGSSIGNNGNTRHLFGVAVYPKADDPAEQQQIAKRLRYRFGEIQGIE